MTEYIEHITLDTGHTRRSLRAEVADEAISACRELIERIRAGQEAAIPGTTAMLTGTAEGRCMIATVWHSADRSPLVTIGVAQHSRCGARLWRLLHAEAARPAGMRPLATAGRPCPAEPWVAARLEIGLALHATEAEWLGDFERCLGWAWLQRDI